MTSDDVAVCWETEWRLVTAFMFFYFRSCSRTISPHAREIRLLVKRRHPWLCVAVFPFGTSATWIDSFSSGFSWMVLLLKCDEIRNDVAYAGSVQRIFIVDIFSCGICNACNRNGAWQNHHEQQRFKLQLLFALWVKNAGESGKGWRGDEERSCLHFLSFPSLLIGDINCFIYYSSYASFWLIVSY